MERCSQKFVSGSSQKFSAWGSKIAHLGVAPSRAKLLVFEAFLDLVVSRTLVEPRQHLPRCRRHISTLIILPSEPLYRIPGVKRVGRVGVTTGGIAPVQTGPLPL